MVSPLFPSFAPVQPPFLGSEELFWMNLAISHKLHYILALLHLYDVAWGSVRVEKAGLDHSP